jgi:hypothetical protein
VIGVRRTNQLRKEQRMKHRRSLTWLAGLVAAGAVAGCSGNGSTASTVAPTTSTAVSLPATLVDRWVGAPKPVGTLGAGTKAAFVEIDGQYLVYNTGIDNNPKAFDSKITAETANTFRLTLSTDTESCRAGDVGHYRWSLSPGRTTLTVKAVDDVCDLRAETITGKWDHTACNEHGKDCLGVVEAGTYSTNRFIPYDQFTYGQLTYTVPDGWAIANDSQAALFLRRASDYTNNKDSFYGISAWADVAAAKQDCSDQPDSTIGAGAANIAAWMESLPDVVATQTTIEINGLPAEVVDVHIAPNATTCQGFVSLIASRTSKPDPFNFGVFGDQQMRVVLIDIAPQRTVAVFIDDALEHRYDELAAVAMPIIESFTFTPTP